MLKVKRLYVYLKINYASIQICIGTGSLKNDEEIRQYKIVGDEFLVPVTLGLRGRQGAAHPALGRGLRCGARSLRGLALGPGKSLRGAPAPRADRALPRPVVGLGPRALQLRAHPAPMRGAGRLAA